MKRRSILFVLIFLISAVFVPSADAEANALFYKEANVIGGYSTRDKWIGKSGELGQSVGFEDYRKFSNDYGDYMTTDLQVRLAYDSLEGINDAWGLQIHNAWLKYKLSPEASAVVGHFDPAFGLEPQLDTHGTLLQTLAMSDIGYKKDWGIGLEGSLPKVDYKTALQIGSGMAFQRRDRSFLWTSRIGSPKSENFQYGVSALYGEVLHAMDMNTFPRGDLMSDEAMLKKRIGMDSQYFFGAYAFKGEISYGTNERTEVLGYLAEVDYTLPGHQNVEVELQFQSWINELGVSGTDDSTATLGLSYKLNPSVTLRTAYSHDLNRVDQDEENKFVVQFYYFGA